MEKVKIKEIIEFLDLYKEKYTFYGNEEESISGFSTILNYKQETITWAKAQSIFEANKHKKIRLTVIPKFDGLNEEDNNLIVCSNPKKTFFNILDFFYKENQECKRGNNNYICDSAIIGKQVSIGNNCTIGENVIIGNGTIILNNVVIDKNVQIGSNCMIKSGAVIGEIGFGYSIDENNCSIRVPHFGCVKIGNNVDIGANTTIERGTIDDTIIEEGVKIDDLCQISHNVRIGKNTNIITNTSVFGSVTIGENCYISTSQIRNQISIGKNVIVGMGSVVVKDIEDNSVVAGVPAEVIRKKANM